MRPNLLSQSTRRAFHKRKGNRATSNHAELSYTVWQRNTKCSKRYEPLITLFNAPATVVEVVKKLYTDLNKKTSKASDVKDADVDAYLRYCPETDLEYLLEVSVLTTDAEENAKLEEALVLVPYTFANKDLLRAALNVGDPNKEYMRLARLGDLVQNLLLSATVIEGTNFGSGFIEEHLKQVLGQNAYQAKKMLEDPLWQCVFTRQPTTYSDPKKLPADVLEAVIGAVWCDCRTSADWQVKCLEVMENFKLDVGAVREAFGEFNGARLLRQGSLVREGGEERWVEGYERMERMLGDARRSGNLKAVGLAE